MIGSTVRIKRSRKGASIETNVTILDKRMTNMAHYNDAAIINNAPFEVYVGLFEDLDDLDVDCPIVEFEPTDILEIIKLKTVTNRKQIS